MGPGHPGQPGHPDPPGHPDQGRHPGQPAQKGNSGQPGAQQGCQTNEGLPGSRDQAGHDRVPGVNHPGFLGQPAANQPGCPGQSTGVLQDSTHGIGVPGVPGQSLRNCVKHTRTRCCSSNCRQRSKRSSGNLGSSSDVCSDATLTVDTDILSCTSTSTVRVLVEPSYARKTNIPCSIEVKMCCSESCSKFT